MSLYIDTGNSNYEIWTRPKGGMLDIGYGLFTTKMVRIPAKSFHTIHFNDIKIANHEKYMILPRQWFYASQKLKFLTYSFLNDTPCVHVYNESGTVCMIDKDTSIFQLVDKGLEPFTVYDAQSQYHTNSSFVRNGAIFAPRHFDKCKNYTGRFCDFTVVDTGITISLKDRNGVACEYTVQSTTSADVIVEGTIVKLYMRKHDIAENEIIAKLCPVFPVYYDV